MVDYLPTSYETNEDTPNKEELLATFNRVNDLVDKYNAEGLNNSSIEYILYSKDYPVLFRGSYKDGSSFYAINYKKSALEFGYKLNYVYSDRKLCESKYLQYNFDEEPEKYSAYFLLVLKELLPDYKIPDELVKVAEDIRKKTEIEEKIAKLQIQYSVLNSDRGRIKQEKIIPQRNRNIKDNISKVEYASYGISFFNELQNELDAFLVEYSKEIETFSQIAMNLEYADDIPEVLRKRNDILNEYLTIDITAFYNTIINMREEMQNLLGRIKSSLTLKELYEIDNIKLPSLETIYDKFEKEKAEILEKVNRNIENYNTILEAIELHNDCSKRYIHITKTGYQSFIDKCSKQKVGKKKSDKWAAELLDEMLIAEECNTNIILEVLRVNLSIEVAKDIIRIIKDDYSDQLIKFYYNGLIAIHQKHSFNKSSGELQEIFEQEVAIKEIMNLFYNSIEDIIFKIEDYEARLLVAKLVGKWYDNQMERIINYLEKSDLNKDAVKLSLQELRNLKSRNLDKIISDNSTYHEYNQKMSDEFNSLMFRMTKDYDNYAKN